MPKSHLAVSTRQNYLRLDARMLMEAVADQIAASVQNATYEVA